MNIFEKIASGEYQTKLSYPFFKDGDKQAYYEDTIRLADKFKEDLIFELDHPKAEQCFSIAFEYGEENGYKGIAALSMEIAKLLKD
jgi:hypothetical protein